MKFNIECMFALLQSSCTKPDMEAESAHMENMQELSLPSESQKHEVHANFNQKLLMHEMKTGGKINFEFWHCLFCSVGENLTFSQLNQICEQLLMPARMRTQQLCTRVLNWKVKERILISWLRLVMPLLIHQEKLLTSWEHLIEIAIFLQ